MSDIAIKIEHVSKEYRLGAIGGGTLRGDLQSWWARVRGKEDPNLRLDQASGHKGDRFLALNDVSMEIKKGEAVGIIGHNGAGKSTLLKLLCRVTAPTKGTISYNGRIASMLEVGTGFHPELTGRENVYMNGAILGMSKAEIDKKFDEIVAFAEMEKFIDTPVKRYSSGMYVKLAFSVAAHLDSEIMIMDEVLAVGDMQFQQKCLDKMRDAAKLEGRTVLYVSHNMNTIRKLCDRCIVLERGKVIFKGDVDSAVTLYMNKAIDMALINECTMPRMRKDLDHKARFDCATFLDKDTYPIFYQGEPIHMMFDLTANKAMENIAFRMTVHSADDARAGMATTDPVISLRQGQNKIKVQWPIDWLAPGKYVVDLVAYSVNEYGHNQLHDVVEQCFSFEKILQIDENNAMTWQHNWWGYVMFPHIEVEK